MNKPLFTSGIIIILIGMIAWLQQHPIDIGVIKGYLRRFNKWAINGGDVGLIVYGGSCGLLVAVITYPWSY